MEVSREFFCPHCKRSLTMSDAMHMRALMHQSGSYYIAMGTVATVTCPGCGGEIGVEDIVAGKHAPQLGAGGWIVTILVWAALIGGGVLLFRSCSG